MQALYRLIIYLLTALLLNLFFPWWVMIPAFLLLGIFLDHLPWRAFLLAFLAVFLVWMIGSIWIDQQNQQILSSRIAELLTLPDTELLWVISGLVGGLPAGFAAMTGVLFKKAQRSYLKKA